MTFEGINFAGSLGSFLRVGIVAAIGLCGLTGQGQATLLFSGDINPVGPTSGT